jgi:hypothetical protein
MEVTGHFHALAITRKTVPGTAGQETGWVMNHSVKHEEEKNFYHLPESESWFLVHPANNLVIILRYPGTMKIY